MSNWRVSYLIKVNYSEWAIGGKTCVPAGEGTRKERLYIGPYVNVFGRIFESKFWFEDDGSYARIISSLKPFILQMDEASSIQPKIERDCSV